jgi:predicted RNA-binding protein
MCQATVFLNGEKLMEDVTHIQLTPDGIQLSTFFEAIQLSTFFEAPQVVRAKIREIDLLKHRVWLDAAPNFDTEGDKS